jgi:catechol 2,3-dioxygenase-like lactoylglutathione lyase family enzyme
VKQRSRIGSWVCVVAVAVSACRSATHIAPAAALDHVMVGVPDLEEGIAVFTAATGVEPIRGGQHPGRGTENALVSLGHGVYLEIIAPLRGASTDDPMVNSLRALKRPTALGWALQVNDAASARAFLRERGFEVTEAQAGSRRTPSGSLLEWNAFGLPLSSTAAVPFFIEWSAPTRHPSTTAPGGCAIEALEIHDPTASTISRLVTAVGVRVPVHNAEQTNIVIKLKCGARYVEYTTQ